MGWIPVDCYLEAVPLITPLRRMSRSNGSKGRACFQMVASISGREAGGRLPLAASKKIGKLQMKALVGN